MIPGLSTVKLIGIAVLALALIGLFGWAKIEQANARRWQATAQTYAAQRDEAIAANTGLTGQVESLTADKADALKRALKSEADLAARENQQTEIMATKDKEIDRAAVKTDDVCSPALAAALGLLCPAGPGADDHAATTH